MKRYFCRIVCNNSSGINNYALRLGAFQPIKQNIVCRSRLTVVTQTFSAQEPAMQSNLLAIRTSPALLTKLRTSTAVKSSARDLLEQRVSFVYGSLAQDSGVTRERVRQVLLEHAGGSSEDQK